MSINDECNWAFSEARNDGFFEFEGDVCIKLDVGQRFYGPSNAEATNSSVPRPFAGSLTRCLKLIPQECYSDQNVFTYSFYIRMSVINETTVLKPYP